MKVSKTRNYGRWLVMVLMVTSGISINAENEVAAQHFDISISNRVVQLDSNVIRITQGAQVTISWTSDEAGSLHLHGYDIEFDVGPKETKSITFLAKATGRFPVTSHGFGGEDGHGHKALLYVEVYPD
jgi:hypothetical protein